MQKRTFQIYRYDPDKDTKPYMQTIEIELDDRLGAADGVDFTLVVLQCGFEVFFAVTSAYAFAFLHGAGNGVLTIAKGTLPLALFGPVAVDLRLVLSLIKISGTLERIADFADGIARHVIEEECAALPDSFKEELRVGTMFDTVISMLSDSFVALESENTKLSGRILAKDETVDEIYHDDIRLLRKIIDDLALALVAPLASHYYNC